MSPETVTLLVFLVGVVAIVLLTARWRWHAFLSILLVTVAVALGAGLDPDQVVACVTGGFGQALSYTTIIVISGFIIGEFLERTGGALTIASAVLRVVGSRRAALAVALAGYIVGVPVMCCDTAFIVLSPAIRGVSARSRVPLPMLALALAVGTYSSFKLIPPSPGPLAVLTLFGADFTRTLLLTLLISVPVMAVGLAWARHQTGTAPAAELPDKPPTGSPDATPGLGAASLPAALPILLIVLKAVLGPILDPAGLVGGCLDLVGHPVIALPIGVFAALAVNRRAGMATMTQWIAKAITRAGSILAIVGAGGALGAVVRACGMGDYLGRLLTGAGIPGLLVPFVLAMALKTAQGSSMVTLFTTPAIVAPLLTGLGIAPEIATLATLAGALAVVHVNDSFFWVVTRFADMDVTAGYKSLTVLSLLQALVALGMVLVLNLVM